jgi:lysozyme family protein
VIGSEGGYTNNPADPGGKTRYGISRRAYSTLDIANLRRDEAEAIYKRDYWDKVRGDDLPPLLALLVFDAAVNNGVSRAALWLQQAVGAEEDGVLGPQTMAAVAAHSGQGVAVCTEFMARRMVFQMTLPTAATFGLGWARRLAALPWHAGKMTA